MAAGPAAGGYRKAEEAQKAICACKAQVYRPIVANRAVYNRLYALYCEVHDSFGVQGKSFDHYGVMKALLDLSRAARRE